MGRLCRSPEKHAGMPHSPLRRHYLWGSRSRRDAEEEEEEEEEEEKVY